MGALYLVSSIRRIEQAALAAAPRGLLMRRAAAAVAHAVEGVARKQSSPPGVAVLAGPGNNGADALMAALMLQERGWRICAWSPFGPIERWLADPEGGAVRRAWHARVGPGDSVEHFETSVTQGAVVIDGLFGIGLARPVDGPVARVIDALSVARVPVVSVDVPSGLDADRGSIVGGDAGIAIRAQVTVTMIADKPGLHTGVARDHVGEIRLATLGVDALAALPEADGELIDRDWVVGRLTPRRHDSHKGTWGSLAVMGGAATMKGAALLAAAGAQSAGIGKVFIATPDTPAFDPSRPHWMTRSWTDATQSVDAIAIGCGMGLAAQARDGLMRAVAAACPVVVDADALTLLSREPALLEALGRRSTGSVITPHPLEAARLLGCATGEVQRDRIAHALRLATRSGAVTLLKGAGTVIATPQGRWAIVDSGAPTLATAGSGDVLAGLIATLLAQGHPPFEAAAMGAWLHGRAGELAAERLPRQTGLAAAELPDLIRTALNLT